MKKTLPLLFLLAACLSLRAADNPKPTEVTPSAPPAAPLVLFDGVNLNAWTGSSAGAAGWTIASGSLTGQPGEASLVSKQSFADCQLHFEARGAADGAVVLQGHYPINLTTTSPDWTVCDVIFRAPRFNNDGSVRSPAFVTTMQNGLVVQDHIEIKGSLSFQGQPGYEKHPFRQPLVLRAMKEPASFRNIWIRELGVQQLLNSKDLVGWYSYLEKLGKGNDPEGNFKIENGLLHVAGKNFGYLATEKSYANYYLRVVFQWGQHQYAPRATGKRDSGILYHCGFELADRIWPKSIECQVQEGDCGDIWCVDGASIDSPNHAAYEWNQKRVYRTADFELPNSEWNTIEVICNGNQAEHYVNGHLVNSGTNATVSSGRILLQSEGAEIFYKSAELIPY